MNETTPTDRRDPRDRALDSTEGAAHPRGSLWILRGLIALGVLSTVYYFSWWGEGGRIASPLLALLLVFAALYHWSQLLSGWVIYLSAGRARRKRSPAGLPETVDVFVTAYREPDELIARTLNAAVAMRGEHRTWLLDDDDDPRLAKLAGQLGAGYIAREGNADAKAGNLNAALRVTDGEVVVVFDADHAPTPDFLERTMPLLADPALGFVQVMLTFANRGTSWFARAAAESCADFFNPTSIGMDGMGSATLIGSNAVIRRRALESIGGYRPGLAEDLATSIALHAHGWESAYVAEPLAPGLAPVDAAAWWTQQFKWARGVFEVMLTDYFKLWPRLRWGQRFAYGVRTSYYWVGAVGLLHLVATVMVLLGGESVAQFDMRQYLFHLLPLAVTSLAIRVAALWVWRHPTVPVAAQWRALVLVYSSWPIYGLAWLLALTRRAVGFRLTPKAGRGPVPWVWVLPQAVGMVLLLGAALAGREGPFPILAGFAVVQALPGVEFLRQILRSYRRSSDPWGRPAVLGQASVGRR